MTEIFEHFGKGPRGGIVGRMIAVRKADGLIFCAVCADDDQLRKFADMIELRELERYTMQRVEILGLSEPPPVMGIPHPPPETETTS